MVGVENLNKASRSRATLERHARLYADPNLPLEDLVRIEDPALYVDPWPIYGRLQREAPVYFYERLNTWILTKYDDVQLASRTPEVFSCQHGILLYDGLKSGAGRLSEMFAEGGDMIGLTDPPRHRELRRIMAAPFTPAALARLQARIEQFCDRLLAPIVPGEQIDWVEMVASRLPVLLVCALLGIPDDDENFVEDVRHWADALEDLASKDLDAEEQAVRQRTFDSLSDFIRRVLAEKRRNPGDDFLSSLLIEHLDDQKLSEKNMIGFAQLFIAAGSETTRSLLSEMVAHLAVSPEARALLSEDLTLVPNAIEEVLRFAPAGRGLGRQIVKDIELRGQSLKVGQRVFMSFEAANRDPDVFERPQEFDIRRDGNRKNVAFGYGTHVCIAAPLVRAETKTLLEKLISSFPRFELAGAGRRIETFLRNGWDELPVVFYPA